MSGVVFHRLDRDRIVQRLTHYARQQLAPRPEVREAILIGSLARGDWSARSDADVVIVVDHADAPWRSRGMEYAPTESVGVAVDLFVYTAEETSAWSPRFRTEVDGGVVLYCRRERDDTSRADEV